MVRDDNGIDYCWYGERDLTLDTDNNIFATGRLEGNVGEKNCTQKMFRSIYKGYRDVKRTYN